VVMPVFALANAGVTFSGDVWAQLTSPIAMGIILGLIVGKFVGIVGVAKLLVALRWVSLPTGTVWRHIYGASLLAAVGFTMSLFITELALTQPEKIIQAKLGILVASFLAGIAGFFLLKSVPPASKPPTHEF
jgi:Na+:H+ antiporter, NhaA family